MGSLHSELMSEYALDGHFYSAQECYTCNFAKPARSKHCCEQLILSCLFSTAYHNSQHILHMYTGM